MSTFLNLTPSQIKANLECAILSLPRQIDQDDPKGGVLRPWVRRLPLRFQGVLATAIRGCDGVPKEDSSKALSRMIRRAILNPADPRESLSKGGFFGFDPERLPSQLCDMFHSLDQYPLHYVMHLCHCCQVIGYRHPEQPFAAFFGLNYALFCHTFHLSRETEADMEWRLTADRVANGTTDRNF